MTPESDILGCNNPFRCEARRSMDVVLRTSRHTTGGTYATVLTVDCGTCGIHSNHTISETKVDESDPGVKKAKERRGQK